MTMVWKFRTLLFIVILGLTLSLVVGAPVHGEVMFEGYSVIRSGETAIGYAVQRYEFDAKKKQFTSTYLLKTNELGGNILESLKAVANDKFQPISYQYTSKTGDKLKAIDAKFAKGQMTATVSDGQQRQQLKLNVPKEVFLSTFLGYLMLQNGYKTEKKFTYSAIAEEDGQAYTGEALIKTEEQFKGEKVFRILNKFKGTQFVSFVTPKGEVLGTTSPLQGIQTELMATPAEATKGLTVPADTLKLLFGSVPTGKTNVLAKKTESSLKPAEPTVKPAEPQNKGP